MDLALRTSPSETTGKLKLGKLRLRSVFSASFCDIDPGHGKIRQFRLGTCIVSEFSLYNNIVIGIVRVRHLRCHDLIRRHGLVCGIFIDLVGERPFAEFHRTEFNGELHFNSVKAHSTVKHLVKVDR